MNDMLLHALLAVCSFGALQEAAHVSAHEAPLVAAWTIDTATPFVGERLTLELALEGSTDFLANEVVTRTLRRLGRAVEFDTGLRPAATALLEVVGFAETTDGPTCVVDGTVVSGARLELADGRERFSVRVDVLATAPGLVQPDPRLVFAVRRARAVGVFGADVTSDYDVHELAVEAPALEVRALPAEAEGLAVGAFELVCDASDAPPAQAGDRLALVARVRGAENLEHVHVPRLESGEALHLLGVLESRSDEERVFTFEVHVVTAPTSPCEFVLETFDPTGAGRVVVLRAPLTVVFAPTADGAAAPIAPYVDLEDPVWNAMMRRMERELFGYVALIVAVVVAVLVGFMALRARRSRHTPDPLLTRAHAARRAAVERGDAAAALAAFVETLFEVPVAARNGAALREHLTRSGVPTELVARVGERIEAALHARYGGEVRATEPSAVDDLCAELERVTRSDPRNER